MDTLTNTRKQFLLTHGYKNISDFARTINEDPSNVRKAIIGDKIPNMNKLFLWASALDVNIIQLISLFYPREMKRNIAEYNIRMKRRENNA